MILHLSWALDDSALGGCGGQKEGTRGVAERVCCASCVAGVGGLPSRGRAPFAAEIWLACTADAIGPYHALTPEQAAALMAKLSTAAAAGGGDGNYSVANLTIAEVLSMRDGLTQAFGA